MTNRFCSCWLTVNRACNMRCRWCYAKDTGFEKSDEMPLERAKKIIDICKAGGIRGMVLIGGEPTVYPHILDVIRYAEKNGISTTLVTNGLLLSDKKRLKEYTDAGLKKVSLSLKAHDKESYKELTGVDGFELALSAIENLKKENVKFSVSTVLTGRNMPYFIKGLKNAKARGAYAFGLSFCYNVCMGEENNIHLTENNPYILAASFQKIYPELKEALGDVYFSLEQALPECVWDENFIKEMQKDRHVHSICQLMAGTGLLFDTDGSLIPCNALHTMKYGMLGKDFWDYPSLTAYLKTPKVEDLFRLLRGAPDERCLSCSHAETCGGGCVTNWTNYSFEELKNMAPKTKGDDRYGIDQSNN